MPTWHSESDWGVSGRRLKWGNGGATAQGEANGNQRAKPEDAVFEGEIKEEQIVAENADNTVKDDGADMAGESLNLVDESEQDGIQVASSCSACTQVKWADMDDSISCARCRTGICDRDVRGCRV